MSKAKSLMFGLLFALPFSIGAQLDTEKIDPQTVTISRDEWGVPHIHAQTDAGAAHFRQTDRVAAAIGFVRHAEFAAADFHQRKPDGAVPFLRGGK